MIDLVGYRRFGHNEGDEPAYTQPLMYEAIERQPPVREQYAARLVEAGVLSADEAEQLATAVQDRMREAHEKLRASLESGGGEHTGSVVPAASARSSPRPRSPSRRSSA